MGQTRWRAGDEPSHVRASEVLRTYALPGGDVEWLGIAASRQGNETRIYLAGRDAAGATAIAVVASVEP